MRASWDETWMNVADAMAGRSLCSNRQVGCVIVDASNRPVAVGYNGAPAGYPKSGGCQEFCPRSRSEDRGSDYKNCVSVHAEANALIFADRRHYAGGTIYVTNPCCWDCAKLVANSGVSRVVLRINQSDKHADLKNPIRFLEECGLDVKLIVRR